MKCDIIIPVWDQLEFTKECVDAILKNTHYPYRLILIDNGSEFETKNYLKNLEKNRPKEVMLVNNDENLGFVKAVNQGLKHSDSPYVCIMNNDTIPAPGWLERMIEFADSHDEVGLVNPQCDGHGNMPLDEYAQILSRDRGKYMEMNQCQGFCMLIKREAVERVGYLDEAFGIGGFDDTDYSMRAHIAGYRCVAIKDAYVYHRLHSSFNASGDREDWVRRNRRIYYDKWGAHLRVGVAVSLNNASRGAISQVMTLAYGLAREWAWVHIWINSRRERPMIKSEIADFFEKAGLAPHQNIRVDYFDLPDTLFDVALSGKLLERIRQRMKDKRFDAVVMLDGTAFNILPRIGKILKVRIIRRSLGESADGARDAAREIAGAIKLGKTEYASSAV